MFNGSLLLCLLHRSLLLRLLLRLGLLCLLLLLDLLSSPLRLILLLLDLRCRGLIVIVIAAADEGESGGADTGAGDSRSQADFNLVEALREELGLNRPVVVQYLDWMYHAFQGEFGDSRRTGDSVAALVSDRLEVTIQLGILSLIVAVVIALPVGLLAGSRPNTPFDYFGTVFAVVGAAIPNFWLALVLILVFAVDFGWFPALGFTSFREDPLENMRARCCLRLRSASPKLRSWPVRHVRRWWKCCNRTTFARPAARGYASGRSCSDTASATR